MQIKFSFLQSKYLRSLWLLKNMNFFCLILITLLFLNSVVESHASNYLLFFEGQGVAGYSEREDKAIWYSKTIEDVMQKSSVGFDYIQKFSSETSDIGLMALQVRLAYDDLDNNLEPQIYNAYFKYKYSGADIWIGHNRPALGLSSYFDSHGLLMNNLSMNGFGYDRDWGVGTYKEFDWGDIAFSLTTGSGMPIYFESNYLASARISKGSLNQDNYNIGLSVAYGDTLSTMGYELMLDEPELFSMAGLDAAYLWDNFEARCEIMGGRKASLHDNSESEMGMMDPHNSMDSMGDMGGMGMGDMDNMDEEAYALLVRLGVNLLDEGRLKFEIQPFISKIGSDSNYEISLGTSYILTSDITLRTMYDYDNNLDDHKIIFQIYYYSRI